MDNQNEQVGVPTESERAPELAKTKPTKWQKANVVIEKPKSDLDARLTKLEEMILSISRKDAEEPKKEEEEDEEEEKKEEKKDAETQDAEPTTAIIPAGSATLQNKNPMLTRLSPKGAGVQGWFMKNETNKRLKDLYKYKNQ